MQIRWTPEAATDLEQIARHILRDNPGAARSVVRTLTEGIERLRKFPNLGCPGQVPNTRELVFASLPYIAIYRLKGSREASIAMSWSNLQSKDLRYAMVCLNS